MKNVKVRKIKKFLFFMVIFFFGLTVYSQFMVKDVDANRKLDEQKLKIVKQLKFAVEQTKKLQSMVETAQKNLDFIEQINSEVKNVNQIKAVAKLQSEVINEAFQLKKKYESTKKLELALLVENSTNQLLENTKQNLYELTRILSVGTYKMNDAERLNEIRNQEKEMQKQRAEIEEIKSILDYYEFAMDVYNIEQ